MTNLRPTNRHLINDPILYNRCLRQRGIFNQFNDLAKAGPMSTLTTRSFVRCLATANLTILGQLQWSS